MIMKLGRKVGNRSEDFFFRDHHDFGRKKGNTRSKPLFFLENTNFWEFLPRAPNFEYPPLGLRVCFIRSQ